MEKEGTVRMVSSVRNMPVKNRGHGSPWGENILSVLNPTGRDSILGENFWCRDQAN